MTERKQIDTTEELARWYDQKYTEMGDGWHTPPEECERHLNDIGVPHDKTRWLLDVGCGAGHFLAEASKRASALGLEISEEGLKHCRRRAPQAFLEKGSIENGIRSNTVAPEGFDYIVSIGSLEHIVDIDRSLDHIHGLLKPEGKWYFYCPNERWKYNDQPNERTYTDEEWTALFVQHRLWVSWSKRWGTNQDNTAFCGRRDDAGHIGAPFVIPAHCKINAGSGQRPFDRTVGWVNMDIQERWQPDLVADWNDLSIFPSESVEIVVSHHSLEHVGCGEGDSFIREAHRVLKPDGRLLIFVPDMRALAQRWLTRQIDTQLYMTNIYGAYMGEEGDRHRWGYDGESLWLYLKNFKLFRDVHAFNWRPIPGANIAKDWWILGMEAIK